MYGSCKSCETGVYKVSYIIGPKKNKIYNNFCVAELIFLLSVIPKGNQEFSELKPWVDDVKPKPERLQQVFESTPFVTLKHYISFLKDTHSEDFLTWRSVGFVLYNETGESNKGRTLWHKFSSGCPEKYNYNTCNEFWNKLESDTTSYGVGTLKYYLKQSGVTDPEPKIRYLGNVNPDGTFKQDDSDSEDSGVENNDSEDESDGLTEREKYEELWFGGDSE